MPILSHTVDPRHRQPLPTGYTLARTLRVLFERIHGAVARQTMQVPDLSGWLKPMVELMRPLLVPLYQEGGKRAAERIARAAQRLGVEYRSLAGRSGGTAIEFRARRKDVLGYAFDVYDPRVSLAIDQAVMAFCQSTLDTIVGDVETAIAALREQMKVGLEAGEAVKLLNRRVDQIFLDPFRAARVAQTEASRAVHAGQFIAAKESGIVTGKRWLASSDACPLLCLPLDGKEVALDQPFVVDPGGGPYASVPYPPRHPHCMCTWTEVIGE